MTLVNPLTALAFFEIAKQNKHRAIINNAAASALGRMVELLGEETQNSGNKYCKKSNSGRETQTSWFTICPGTVLDPSFIQDLGIISRDLSATLLFDSVCSMQLEQMCNVLPYGKCCSNLR